MGALVSVHGFEIRRVPHDVIFAGNAIATVHVAGDAEFGKYGAAVQKLKVTICSGYAAIRGNAIVAFCVVSRAISSTETFRTSARHAPTSTKNAG